MDSRKDVPVIALESSTTTDPKLTGQLKPMGHNSYSPNVDRRLALLQKLGEIFVWLKASATFEKVKSADICMISFFHPVVE